MKVYFLNRPRIPGNFSFENIFDSVEASLKGKVEIVKFYCTSFFDLRAMLKMPKLKASVFHITGAVHYLALTLPKKNTVLTIHDIGAFENMTKGTLKYFIYKKLWLKWPAKRVQVITVVSNYTKQKLVSVLGVNPDKIQVVPNPIVYDFDFEPKNSIGERIKILQIGTGPHKNIGGLIKAAEGLPVHLILVSRLATEELALLNALNISYENHFNVPEEQLKQFYKDCDLLYFASFHEGFGMPIIEAMCLGRPVITSNFGAMLEIAQDHAHLVDPYKIEEIRTAISNLLYQNDTYFTKLLAAHQYVQQYKATVVANQYYCIYQSISKN